jgi:hypothetical protein
MSDYYTHTSYSKEFTLVNGEKLTVKLLQEPSSMMAYAGWLQHEANGKLLIGYLVDDSDCEDPLEDSDGYGHIYSGNRHGDSVEEYIAAVNAAKPFTVMLDVYEHDGIAYSISGTGMQCPWDTAKGGAVWVPNQCCLDEINAVPKADRRARTVELARQAAAIYTDWCNGNCFGIVTLIFDTKTGEMISDESCYGYIGDDDVYSVLQEEFNILKGTL